MTGINLLATCDVGGRCDTLQVMLYRGHAFTAHPFSGGFSVVDIRDPRAPRTVAHVDKPPGSRTLHLQQHDGLLLVTSEADMADRPRYLHKDEYFGQQLDYDPNTADNFTVGVQVYDVTTPAEPRLIRFLVIPGFGVHRLFWDGGHLATASEMPAARPDFILTALDMSEPTDPRVIDRWAPQEMDDSGNRVGLHHAILGGPGGDLAFGAWRAGGLQIVDLSAKPRKLGSLDPTAWGGGATHTTLPLTGRNLVVVADESVLDAGADGLRRIWLVDVADLANPAVIGALPEPAEADFVNMGGVFGPHNLHENRADSWRSENLIFATYQNAGVRAYDISDVRNPQQVAYCVPPPPRKIHDPRTPGGPLVAQTSDLFVTDDGLIVASDLNAGLTLMQFEGGA